MPRTALIAGGLLVLVGIDFAATGRSRDRDGGRRAHRLLLVVGVPLRAWISELFDRARKM